jgi:hypothetical protein
MNKRPFKIAMWQPDLEQWKILAHYKTYDSADNRLEYYADRFPHAWVTILDTSI